MSEIQAVKGTHDILPGESAVWQRVEAVARDIFRRYGYREMRVPIFEATGLFARGIGAETDIVSKEMYTFVDRDETSSLTLRPEATAGIVRSVIEHNLLGSEPALRVYTQGPMFRRERPQKGRFRQFHQIDVEAFGLTSPTVDAEVVEMALGFLAACGVTEAELVLNSVGCTTCRPLYVDRLREALQGRASAMCEDCQRRAERNPLRVLDCKVPADQAAIEALPRIADHLCAECRSHFDEVKRQLGLLGIAYRESHRLVRGLDYYVRTTFEVTCGQLGAQNSVLGGGRYDGLVKDLGGPDAPGIGFAVGVERLVMLMPAGEAAGRCDVFVLPLAPEAGDRALLLQRELRGRGVAVQSDPEGRSFKARMKLANRMGARFVAILGGDELARGVWTVRDMRDSTQETIEDAQVADYLKEKIDG